MATFLFLVTAAFGQGVLLPAPADEFALERDYSVYVLSAMSDPLGFEAELSSLDVDARSASLMRVEDATVTRVALADDALNPIPLKGRARCGEIVTEWWPKNVVVRTPENRTDGQPTSGLVLVEGNPTVGAVAELSAGGSLEHRTVRYQGRLVSESMTLAGDRELVLRKSKGHVAVCLN